MDWKNRLDIFDILILVVLVSMIVLSPLAMGSVAPWARNSLFILSLTITALWLLQGVIKKRLLLVREPVLIFAGLFLLVAFAQLIPLDPGRLEAISPQTAQIYERTLENYPESGEARSLSITPYNTSWAMQRLISFILVFLVIINTFRKRSQVVTIVLALVAVGSFEAIYGFAERFSGSNHIFWNEKIFNTEAVTGTFINKNHFAGLLEMILPMALGYFMTIAPRWNSGGNFRARAVDAISGSGLHRQIILGLLIVIMAVAVLFSLSRAGLICMVGSLVAFFLFVGMTAGFRKYTLILLLMILVILCVALGIGTEMVIERIEEAASSQSISWRGRVDLWYSGLEMTKDFPLLGSGFGTFEEVFERYQSPRFGDRYADYLHNDWLQVFCETGAVGGLIGVGGVLFLFAGLMRKTLKRHDPFCRWMSIGGLAACGAMFVHSLFDFNLYKITSNGIIFAIIFGVWHATANNPGKSSRSKARIKSFSIPLESVPLRAVILLGAVGLPAFFTVGPVRTAMADIHLNNYLASSDSGGQAHNYYFLPVSGSAGSGSAEDLDRALALDERNPRILFAKGIERVDSADQLVRSEARETALSFFKSQNLDSADQAKLRELEDTFFLVHLVDMADERLPFLEEARDHVQKAISQGPATKRFHLAKAEIVGEMGRPELSRIGDKAYADTRSIPGAAEARIALWLAANKPGTLLRAGRILLVNAINNGTPLDESPDLDFIEDCFRRSIASNPLNAEEIYPLIHNKMNRVESLFSVTPKTIRGYEALARYLWKSNRWDDVLLALDRIQELIAFQNGESDLESLDHTEAMAFEIGSDGYDMRDPLDVLISISQRRIMVFGILKRFTDRKTEVRTWVKLVRRKFTDTMDQARFLMKGWRYRDAYLLVSEVLERDWADPETLLLAAELSLIPSSTESAVDVDKTFNSLFRLVLLNDTLSAGHASKASTILENIRLRTDGKKLAIPFIEGSIDILTKSFDHGCDTLRRITDDEEKSSGLPNRNHLTWFYLGLGLEGEGKADAAINAYLQVLESVPTHLDTLRRLASLKSDCPVPFPAKLISAEFEGKPTVSEALEALLPETRTDIVFGGKIVLLGYGMNKKATGSWDITYYWQFLDALPANSYSSVHFCNNEWRILFKDDHPIGSGEWNYPVDNPRSGEVLVERRELSFNLDMVEFLTVSIVIPEQPSLLVEGGERLFRTKIF